MTPLPTRDIFWCMASVEPLLTTGQVADRLGVNPETVRRWVRLGSLSAVTLPSGRRRFRAEDVEAVLATHSTPARAS